MTHLSWVVGPSFGLNNLQLETQQLTEPDPHEVQVAIEAISLNYRDLLVIKGSYNPKQPIPFTPCSDACGRIVALGSKVTEWALGDRVVTCFAPDWKDGPPSYPDSRQTTGSPLPGVLTQRRNFKASELIPAPKNLTSSEASTLPIAGLTAWNAVVGLAKVPPDGVVLIQGLGGVSSAALDIASAQGWNPILITRNPQNAQLAKDRGAKHVIIHNGNSKNWLEIVRQYTHKAGVDLVVEVAGSSTLKASLAACKLGGQVSLIGNRTGAIVQDFNILPIIMGQLKVQGILAGHQAGLKEYINFIEAHDLHPLIDTQYSFTEAPKALAHLEQGGVVGNIIITCESC